jgi:hypothetical protein
MDPLQRKVLEDQYSQLIAGLVVTLFRYVGVYPNSVHVGPAHQPSIRPQPILRTSGRIDVRGQVVDPPQKRTLTVEIDLPIAQLYGAHTETHSFLLPVTDQEQLVQRLLPPIPGPPEPGMQQEKLYLEPSIPGLNPHLFFEFGSRRFETQRAHMSCEARACSPPSVKLQERPSTSRWISLGS